MSNQNYGRLLTAEGVAILLHVCARIHIIAKNAKIYKMSLS